jgi:hypothetical protein
MLLRNSRCSSSNGYLALSYGLLLWLRWLKLCCLYFAYVQVQPPRALTNRLGLDIAPAPNAAELAGTFVSGTEQARQLQTLNYTSSFNCSGDIDVVFLIDQSGTRFHVCELA